ncbi:MAG TPA: DegQ family serine endoprotease [Candidatus Acidoferrales bacterium]|jgi:serine protease Do|nr:DegQ family serine endoprotease [Candidatus Acidoferrales bacterium]
MDAPRRKSNWGFIVAIIVAVLVIGGFARWRMFRVPGERVYGAPKVALNIATNTQPLSLGEFKNGFASVIDPDLPAVVNISSTKVVKRQNQLPDFFSDPFFRQFFGDQSGPQNRQPQSEREYSLGSGVIVNPNGYILTNNHVVSGASDVEIFTQDKKKFKARVIGTDPRTDIGVLKIEASGLPTLTVGDSSQLKVGDLVFAIGDPFGIGETATAGIVSATGRTLGGAIEQLEDFIQTDAPINPGNSGGALIDLHGNLIGINTAIISGQGGGNQGIGFAIPMNMARNVMDQIVEHGKVVRGYLGVTIQGVDADMAKAFGLPQGGGALVGDVSANSPAAKAGIERGDVILELNGQKINSPDDLSVRVSEMPPGTVAHLKVFRNAQTRDVNVTLGEFPANPEAAQGQGAQQPSELQGLQVENLTPDIARQLGIRASQTGVVVTAVDPSSQAAAAGIQTGDLIQEVNHTRINNVTEYERAIAAAGKNAVLLLINRQGTTHFVIVQPQ